MGSSSLDAAAILHFWSDIVLVEIEHGIRSQVLSGAIQGAEYFSSVFSDGSYIRVPFEVVGYPRIAYPIQQEVVWEH